MRHRCFKLNGGNLANLPAGASPHLYFIRTIPSVAESHRIKAIRSLGLVRKCFVHSDITAGGEVEKGKVKSEEIISITYIITYYIFTISYCLLPSQVSLASPRPALKDIILLSLQFSTGKTQQPPVRYTQENLRLIKKYGEAEAPPPHKKTI